MLTNITTFQFALLFILIYICIFAIVNRICKCIEACSVNKGVAAAMISTAGRPGGSPESLLKHIQQFREQMDQAHLRKIESEYRKEKNNDSGTV